MEWGQDRTHVNKRGTYQRNIDGSLSTFIQSNLKFRGPKGKCLDHIYHIIIDDVSTIHLTWRYQKNLDNGQVILFSNDTQDHNLYSVAPTLRILNISDHFTLTFDQPLDVLIEAKGKKKKRSLKHIDDIYIDTLLREDTKVVHSIN